MLNFAPAETLLKQMIRFNVIRQMAREREMAIYFLPGWKKLDQ